MKKGGFLLFLIFSFIDLTAQTNSRFTAEINYGIQGNFFVRSYNESDGPQPSTEFSNKNFIGSIGGLTIKYKATKMAFWGFGYSQSTNKRIINYNNNISGVRLFISDFQINHINHFFEGFYQRNVSKKIANIKYELGLFYLRSQQQEVDIIGNNISFGQRNFKNSSLEEGGAFAGCMISKMIDTKFELGIKARLYYLISTNTLETISLTPTLAYHF